MKGIPTPCITYYAKQNNRRVLDLCKDLYKGIAITFDLTNQGTKFVCRNNKDYSVSNVSNFTRKCQFVRDGCDKILIN